MSMRGVRGRERFRVPIVDRGELAGQSLCGGRGDGLAPTVGGARFRPRRSLLQLLAHIR